MSQRGELYVYELRTYSKKNYPLTEKFYEALKLKMKQGVKLLEMPDGALVAVSNIADVPKIQMSMADMNPKQKKLPNGSTAFDPNGPGYKKFLEMWRKTNPSTYGAHIRRMAERTTKEEVK